MILVLTSLITPNRQGSDAVGLILYNGNPKTTDSSVVFSNDGVKVNSFHPFEVTENNLFIKANFLVPLISTTYIHKVIEPPPMNSGLWTCMD
jgi:hypothetical protein